MLHEPASQGGKDPAADYKMRLGVWMFLAYCLLYAVFVTLNLTNPLLMEAPSLFGLNLATVFGFGLIVVALIQALIYDALCRRQERELKHQDDEGGDR
jgi:uncharacterized membrane protein (DUF485 family)